MLKRESFCILAIIAFAMFITSYAQAKGREKAINLKIERWESVNYHLTDFRKGIIMKACMADINRADSLIDAYGREQPNFDK